MRRLILLFLVLILVLAGSWLGGESLLIRELRRLSDAGLGFSAAAITPLRDAGRLGAHLREVTLAGPQGSLSVASADLSLRPLSPTTARLDLPATAIVDLGAGPQALGLTAPQAWSRFRPLSGFAPGAAHLASGPMTLDGAALAEGVALTAEPAGLGPDAPPGSVSAYDLRLALSDLSPAALPQLASAAQALGIAGGLTLTGQGRLWLDGRPTPGALAVAPPQPTGLRLDTADLRFGRLSARVVGQIRPDAQGRAQGAIAIYTGDATAMIEAAASAGMIPRNAVRMAGTMLRTLSAMPMPDADGAAPDYPRPQSGELRLPILFDQGRTSLGPIPLGPAPLLR